MFEHFAVYDGDLLHVYDGATSSGDSFAVRSGSSGGGALGEGGSSCSQRSHGSGVVGMTSSSDQGHASANELGSLSEGMSSEVSRSFGTGDSSAMSSDSLGVGSTVSAEVSFTGTDSTGDSSAMSSNSFGVGSTVSTVMGFTSTDGSASSSITSVDGSHTDALEVGSTSGT